MLTSHFALPAKSDPKNEPKKPAMPTAKYTLVITTGTLNTSNTSHIAINAQSKPMIPEITDEKISHHSPFELNSPRLSLPM